MFQIGSTVCTIYACNLKLIGRCLLFMIMMVMFFMFMLVMMVMTAGTFFMFMMFFMMVVMLMAFGCDHCIGFFLCGNGTDFFLNAFPLIMITVIGQRTVHEVQYDIRYPFDPCNLMFQIRRTVCTIYACNLKLIRCGFFFMMMFMLCMFVHMLFSLI